MATLKLIPIQRFPIPPASDPTHIYASRYVDGDVPERFDFTMLLVADQNITGLTESDISVSYQDTDTTKDTYNFKIVEGSLKGSHSVYSFRVRPVQFIEIDEVYNEMERYTQKFITAREPYESGISGTATFTISRNAVSEGNPAVETAFKYTLIFGSAFQLYPTRATTDWELLIGSRMQQEYEGILSTGRYLNRENKIIFTHGYSQVDELEIWDLTTRTRDSTFSLGHDPRQIAHWGFEEYLLFIRKQNVSQTDAPKFSIVNEDGEELNSITNITYMDGDTERNLNPGDWAVTKHGILVVVNGGFVRYTFQEIQDAFRGAALLPVKTAENFNEAVEEPGQNLTPSNLTYDPDTDKIYCRRRGLFIWVYDAETFDYIHEETMLIPPYAAGWTGPGRQGAQEATLMGVADGYLYMFVFGFNSGAVDAIPERLYRTPLKGTGVPKPLSQINPMFLKPGESLDLTRLLPNHSTGVQITFDIGFDKPNWLSINSDYELVVDKDLYFPVEERSLRVTLKAINRFGATEDGAFSFYLTVLVDDLPVWDTFTLVHIYSDQELDLRSYVQNADRLTWQRGFSPPSGYTLTDGRLSVAGASQTQPVVTHLIEVSAVKGTAQANHAFRLRVSTRARPSRDAIFRPRVYIEAVDVSPYLEAQQDIDLSPYLLNFPVIQKSLDSIRRDAYRVDTCQVKLTNNKAEGYPYFKNATFWTNNGLNPSGILNRVTIFLETLRDPGGDGWDAYLLFEGVILENTTPVEAAEATLTVVDATYFLRKQQLNDMSKGIRKIAQLTGETRAENSDTEILEGQYTVPEPLQPALPDSAEAVVGQTTFELKPVQNRKTLSSVNETAYLTPSQLLTQGQVTEEPLLKFRTPEKRVSLQNAITRATRPYDGTVPWNPQTDLATKHLSENAFQSRGNPVFDTELGRTERYPVDWIYDNTGRKIYLLLSNPATVIRDRLIVFDVDHGTSTVLYEFESSRSVHAIASADFEKFYILTAEKLTLDRGTEVPPTETVTQGMQYNSAAYQSDTRIIEYDSEFNDVTERVGASHATPPQLGILYPVGYGEHYLHSRNIVPSNRSRFVVVGTNLYYRYANATQFGIARMTSTGSVRRLSSYGIGNYPHYLNFDFDVDSSGNIYIATTESSDDGDSSLTLTRIPASGASSTIYEATEDTADLTDLDSDGGTWLGVYELLKSGNDYFAVVATAYERRTDIAAGAVLYHLKQGQARRVLSTAPYAHTGPRSLIYYSGRLYFFEAPSESDKFVRINYDRETFDEETRTNTEEEGRGRMKSIALAESAPTDHGNFWTGHNEATLNRIYCKALAFDNAIHIIAGRGNPETIQQAEHPLIHAANLQILSFGSTVLNFADLPTSGTSYDALIKLAQQAGATLVAENDTLTLKNRDPYSAEVSGTIGNTLPFNNANHSFPTSGYLLIENEIIQYTGRTDTAFTGLTRDVLGFGQRTTGTTGTDIIYLDTLLENQEQGAGTYQQISYPLKIQRVFNTIADSNARIRLRDTSSIDTFGDREFQLNTGLTANEVPLLERLAEDYLSELSDLTDIVRLVLTPRPDLQLGDVVCFTVRGTALRTTTTGTQESSEWITPIRIIEISHDFNGDTPQTQILGQEVKPRPLTTTGGVRGQVATNFRFARSLEDVVGITGRQLTPFQLPHALDGIPPYTYSVSGLPENVFFDARIRKVYGAPLTAATTEISYTVSDSSTENEDITRTFDLIIRDATGEGIQTLNGLEEVFMRDGQGDNIIFRGA